MDYRDLLIWQRSMDLCVDVYELTASFPKHETYGLAAQLRRSIVSVASNISEGEGRLTVGERRQFLSQARGSLFEVSTQLDIARRLYGTSDEFDGKLGELRRMLDAYIAHVRRR